MKKRFQKKILFKCAYCKVNKMRTCYFSNLVELICKMSLRLKIFGDVGNSLSILMQDQMTILE